MVGGGSLPVIPFRASAGGGPRGGHVPGSLRLVHDRRTYVLDTSVLLPDPRALTRFDEHDVVIPLTHIRGRSLHDALVIVDEAQSLESNVLLTVLSRIGRDSRVVLTHDVTQRDNLRVGRHDGVVAVVEKLNGHPLFAHVTFTRSERSPITALVTELLGDLDPL